MLSLIILKSSYIYPRRNKSPIKNFTSHLACKISIQSRDRPVVAKNTSSESIHYRYFNVHTSALINDLIIRLMANCWSPCIISPPPPDHHTKQDKIRYAQILPFNPFNQTQTITITTFHSYTHFMPTKLPTKP